MPRPQFRLRTILVLMLAVACFCGGIKFERERIRREHGIWLDVGTDVGSDLLVSVVGPGHFALNRRSLFTIETMLWLMVVVVAFLAGAAWQRRIGRRPIAAPASRAPDERHAPPPAFGLEESAKPDTI